MITKECDLIIVGAGPSGFSAAINGASEGLKVAIIDSGPDLGGQAAQSSLIENYPGFPEGISGTDLIERFVRQARNFNADILFPQRANRLIMDGRRRIVTTKEDCEFVGRMVILSGGLSYRKLQAAGMAGLYEKGVRYGAPTCDPHAMGTCSIGIVGGANSAGQAAMHMSKNPCASVRLYVRKKIADQMSTYLIDRIRATPNIEVVEGVEVIEVAGEESLERVTIRNLVDKSTTKDDLQHLFIFIGAQPKVEWLGDGVAMDKLGFIRTGADLDDRWSVATRDPFGFETSMPGVFCCGDLRLGSTKRIAAAGGEGVVALQHCHNFTRIPE